MRCLAIFIAIALGVMPTVATAQRNTPPSTQRNAPPSKGGGFNLSNDAPSTRTPNTGNSNRNTPNTGNSNRNNNTGGFNLGNDVPPTRTPNTGISNPSNNVGKGTGNTNSGNRTGNTNVNNSNGVNNTNVTNRTGNTNNTNVKNVSGNNTNVKNVSGNNVNISGNNVNVNRNVNVHNGYGYRGPVIVNPIYRGPAWGWNHGVAWVPVATYWGGGFWGPFAAGVATAVVMGAIVNSANHQTYTSYQVAPGSPGAQLLSNYHLQQVSCGPPNLVVIYGPNNGVICANPNNLVSAGTYAINADNLTLQSP
jgi:hypothetical protein